MKMKKSCIGILLLLCTALDVHAQDGWKLVWSDEFNKDGPLDSSVWGHETGYARNEEAQWYQSDNAICKDGCLVIEARKEQDRSRKNPYYESGSKAWPKKWEFVEYTSSSVNTAGKKDFLYGRFEIKARIPVAKGAWPAIWTLGSNMEWPSNGEIDIMEYYQIKGVPHILANAAWGTDRRWNAKWNSKATPYSHFTDKDPDWASKFHIWRMDWDEEAIKLYLDDELLNEIPLSSTINGSIGNGTNPFTKPQYLLLNLALGGINGGPIDESALPMKYEIDYVRVYQKEKSIASGKVWRDTDGNVINAHGGGVLLHEGKYYWFGEHRPESGFVTEKGVSCYSSTDLLNWKCEGIALAVSDEAGSDIEKGCIMERPKVIYNKKTGKFVMWLHLELKGQGYGPARAAVAVSDSPVGPYRFIRSGRVNPGVYPLNMTKKERKKKWNGSQYEEWWSQEWYKAIKGGKFVQRDLPDGQMSRDMTLFVDDDDKAYHIYSSEDNLTLQIAELSDDYLSHTGKYIRILPGGHNEAPAIFKKDGVYWMVTSGCTGWDPNKARLLTADSILGEWKQLPNPCVGKDSEITFGGQSTYILPLAGMNEQFIFMADMWRPKSLADSRYIWLPIQFDAKGVPFIEWADSWKP
ncbi:family 16 glycosylhydrolase [uncultured Bacteroides sp.]|uniref:family 43 glycosylhydrolase n=2 Tax=uncultured Bacteroides sp. TaxID=162156 RepID=UPI0025D5A15B|nr:family 16 glycosylhydrolase [uncultured Bacteroides sp.]